MNPSNTMCADARMKAFDSLIVLWQVARIADKT